MSRHVNVMDRDESDAEMVERLQRTWDIWGSRSGEPLKRLVNCLDAGETINLSGIERDLIVYALGADCALKQYLASRNLMQGRDGRRRGR